jgi:hypothetical protein
MKILLVYPPVSRSADLSSGTLPLGLLTVAGFLRVQGHRVRALNLELGGSLPGRSTQQMRQAYGRNDVPGYVDNPQSNYRVRFRQVLVDFLPDRVAIGCLTEQIDAARRLAEDARLILPKVAVEFGDAASRSSAWIRQVSEAAFMSDPALDLLAGQNPPDSFGLVLTTLASPERSRGAGQSGKDRPATTFLPTEVLDRRIQLAVELGATRLDIVDDAFTVNLRHAIDVANLLGRTGLPWIARVQADAVVRQAQLVDYFKSHGCVEVTFAIDSGSPRVLGFMQQEIDPAQFLRAGDVLDHAGMPYAVTARIGYPGETDEDVGLTVSLIGQLAARRVWAGSVVPYHGTVLHDRRPDIVARAAKWPFCRWSPFDPTFLCNRKGNRLAGPSASAIGEFYAQVESVNGSQAVAQTRV